MELQNNQSSQVPLSHRLREGVILIAGSIFHTLLSGGDLNLEKTSQGYLEKTGVAVSIDSDSRVNIEQFKQGGRGIIISNHESGVFSDYLPLFSVLGDEILRKSIFYTGAYNLAMNQREFPEYQFRAATLVTREDASILKAQIHKDMDHIKTNGGYIFIIPSGSNTAEDAAFQAIFSRMIAGSENDLPVLSNKVYHDHPMGYGQIVKSMIGLTKTNKIITTVTSKLGVVGDWKGEGGRTLSGKNMRAKYNTMFWDE